MSFPVQVKQAMLTPAEAAAYAMAKYSRSDKQYEQLAAETTEAGAERFMGQFVIGYGHRSVRDLAMTALAVENISMLAAIELEDDPLWSGQERSSRYQRFVIDTMIIPPQLAKWPEWAEPKFRQIATMLYAAYSMVHSQCMQIIAEAYPEAEKRTVSARAFDVARFMLPVGSGTSIGQIASARTLERQIRKLRDSGWPEFEAIADALEEGGHQQAPTLIKHTDSTRWHRLRITLENLAYTIEPERKVRPQYNAIVQQDVEEWLPAAIALAAYDPHSRSVPHFLYSPATALPTPRQVLKDVADLITDRDEHEEWSVYDQFPGQPMIWDMVLDIGSYRDLHRHRRMSQVHSTFSGELGYLAPRTILTECLGRGRDHAMLPVVERFMDETLAEAVGEVARLGSVFRYLLPLATNVRMVAGMDLAQFAYICELRSKVGGHEIYRQAVHDLHKQALAAYPQHRRSLEKVRLTPRSDDDLVKRA